MSLTPTTAQKLALVCLFAAAVAAAINSAHAAKGFAVIYEFCPGGEGGNCPDGDDPEANLARDAAGNFYGTAEYGGKNASSLGDIFRINPNGTETTLYSFCASGIPCTDGGQSDATLVSDQSGNFYGTNLGAFGGNGSGGTIFKLDRTGELITLYTFCPQSPCTDGATPHAGVIRDRKGNLYGTAMNGGTTTYADNGNAGGVVYRLSPKGKYTVLYDFCSRPKREDGSNPVGRLLRDRNGNLYGVTQSGGKNTSDHYCQFANDNQCGTVFKVAPDGTETVLHAFCSEKNCKDGSVPELQSTLVMDTAGNLYGTASQGGNLSNNCEYGSCGVVFKITSDGAYSVLYAFCPQAGCVDGSKPRAGVLVSANGTALYGTASNGGANNVGTVFSLSSSGTETVLHSFGSADDGFSNHPYGGVIQVHGHLYGTTVQSDGNNGGIAYRVGTNGGN